MDTEESLIRQQIEYYRARAPEYDEWCLRLGRYDRGEEHRRRWFTELNEVSEALETSHPRGTILELACGTGLWTRHLAPQADRLVAVDVSTEAIEINRGRLENDKIDYVEADLFSWRPRERFDYVFFGFWLSHVPASRIDAFWDMVKEALVPGGVVFFVDNLQTHESTAYDHEPPETTGRALRKLNDGRQFEIIKVFYEPDKLERDLAARGLVGYVRGTETFFLYGCLRRK